MQRKLRSLLNPQLVHLLEQKLESNEISPDECREVIKEMMLREYRRKQDENLPQKLRTKVNQIWDWFGEHGWKYPNRPPAEASLGYEEMAGTVRTRRF